MSVTLYDLVARDDLRFSPWCWATKMALAHKGIDCVTIATPFGGIADLPGPQAKTLPTIQDGSVIISDSLKIAAHLERHYAGPSLFGGSGGAAGAQFFHMWVGCNLVPQIARLTLLDMYEQVLPADQAYFRSSREKLFGMSLEQTQAGREQRLNPFRESLTAARLVLRKQSFLGGETPHYMDYQLFCVLQWARVISAFELLADGDPVLAWFSRCLDLHDGLGRSMRGYWG